MKGQELAAICHEAERQDTSEACRSKSLGYCLYSTVVGGCLNLDFIKINNITKI
jgi:hypothetical protein